MPHGVLAAVTAPEHAYRHLKRLDDATRHADVYERRNPEQGVLFLVLQEHLTTFLSTAADAHDGVGVPKFVEKELRAFLKCGVLAHGFALLRCADCKHDHVVGLSCKGRGFCPRCGGRRMTEQAAHLVDHVLPFVPMRQWVLTLPHRLRYRLGYDHALCKQILRIFVRALRDHYRMKTGEPLGEIGCITFIHRFNSALGLEHRSV